MPKRRKGPMPYRLPREFLIRDAVPTWREIEGEPDPRKRRERERARDDATTELLRMYRNAVKSGAVRKLYPLVRQFCEGLMKHDPARAERAMRARTGAPDKSEWRMRIAVAVALEIEARSQERGSVEQALNVVASRFRCGYHAVRKIHYETDPRWRRARQASVSMWKLHELVRTNPQAAEQHRRRFEERHGKPDIRRQPLRRSLKNRTPSGAARRGNLASR